jgi:hypothetical protein
MFSGVGGALRADYNAKDAKEKQRTAIRSRLR